MRRTGLPALFATSVLLSGCGADPEPPQYGADPDLPRPQRGLLPAMSVAGPAEWGDQLPTVPQGYTIRAIATDLGIPRQTLLLPNGDILVAEGRGGSAPSLLPKDVIAGFIKARGTTSVESGNRLTLLRDADGDGVYEMRTVFAENLNAPYGLALVEGSLYVANQDALVRFEYRDGQTRAEAPPTKVTDLPSAINHHWTKALAASADGRFLYVGIGSNSNITERGMAAEVDRAVVWQVDAGTGARRTFATGLRNPTALAIQPGTGRLWAAVNERDENRAKPVGYEVVFVPFRDGRPDGEPVDFVSGFLGSDGKARGRPVGVTVDPRGALIVADDLSNTIWRVTPES